MLTTSSFILLFPQTLLSGSIVNGRASQQIKLFSHIQTAFGRSKGLGSIGNRVAQEVVTSLDHRHFRG